MNLLAHLTEQNQKRLEQTLAEHSKGTAEYASRCLQSVGLYHTGYLAGLLHDMGKATAKYNAYLEAAFRKEKVVRGSVIHTFTGVIWLLEQYHQDRSDKWEKLASEVIGYAIGAHHGLFDCVDLSQNNGFMHRLQKNRDELCYEEAVANFLEVVADPETIEQHFALAVAEIRDVYEKSRAVYQKKSENMYQMSMLIRLVLSAVIYGDRRDTAEFMDQKRQEEDIASDWTAAAAFFEQKIQAFDTSSELNRVRGEISQACLEAAAYPPGIYRLNLPTGAGKTLASLRYALAHAKKYEKKRIVFLIPLLSILEQNAKAIKDFLPTERMVLEHHSNVIREKAQTEEADRCELAAVSWNDNPVIISTLVQFLNLLFSGETSAIARMQALCDSVIVIDEIQSLPKKVTSMFNMAINFLQQFCNATVLLCSATQPCWEKLDWAVRLAGKKDLVCLSDAQKQLFVRAEIINKTTCHGISLQECALFCGGLMERHEALLIICNTKHEALELYRRLKSQNEREAQGWTLFHLSTSMCPKHRTEVIRELKTRLAALQEQLRKGEQPGKLICVSTQLAEAGIDFSFDAVVRLMAGIDNLAQAAGRCNRSNEYGYPGTVYLVKIKDSDENLSMLKDIQKAKDAADKVIYSKKSGSLIDEEATQEYYLTLFEEMKNELDYPEEIQGESYKLARLLANENQNAQKGAKEIHAKFIFHQPFATVGQNFRVFDDNTTDILVPYQEGKAWIESLAALENGSFSPAQLKNLTENLNPFSISVFDWQVKALDQAGYLRKLFDGRILVLDEKAYDDKACGLLYEKEQPVENYIL